MNSSLSESLVAATTPISSYELKGRTTWQYIPGAGRTSFIVLVAVGSGAMKLGATGVPSRENAPEAKLPRRRIVRNFFMISFQSSLTADYNLI